MRRLDGPVYALAIGFWLLTAVYALLSSQPFAYEQFLQPQLLRPLAWFAQWHAWINPCVFALVWFVRRPMTEGRGERATKVLRTVWGTAVVVLLLAPPLFELTPGTPAQLLAGLALIPVALLVWTEWSDASTIAREGEGRSHRSVDDFAACMSAGALAALLYALVGGMTGAANASFVIAGFVQSLLVHGLLFSAVFCGLSLVRGLGPMLGARPRAAELALATAALAGVFALVVRGIALPAASLSGTVPTLVGSAAAVLVALAIAARGIATTDSSLDGVARVLRPLAPGRVGASPLATGLWLLLLGAIATALAVVSAQLDFNGVISRTGVVTLWVLLLATCLRCVRAPMEGPPTLLYGVACALLVIHVALGSATASAKLNAIGIDVAKARSAGIRADPSFRLLRRLLEPPADAGVELFAFLQRHTNISRSLAIEPVELSLAPLQGEPSAYRPHIFLFVVDSLRRDYVSAYNPAVTFTPEIGRFAQDATVFRHAITRYGATGLSVPALWVGAPLLHKQYVTPFAPMNTLAKLLEHEGYAQWVGMDNILDVILASSPVHEPLDVEGGKREFTFCHKLDTIEERLAARGPDEAPVFAYTLPQDIHVSVVTREGGRSIDEGNYAGFSAPVASRIRRFDACFGRFVETLHRLGLYDDSLIVLTSDHGDSLGEEGRIGHAYGLFPEVIRIPLIISLPARLRDRFEADPLAPVYNTDVTPSLYRLLGHELAPSFRGFGRPLFTPPGEAAPVAKEGVMVASSYGAVYGALLDAATKLYIVDTVNVREHGFGLAPDAAGQPLPVDARLRMRGQAAIRATIEELAALHRYEPEP